MNEPLADLFKNCVAYLIDNRGRTVAGPVALEGVLTVPRGFDDGVMCSVALYAPSGVRVFEYHSVTLRTGDSVRVPQPAVAR